MEINSESDLQIQLDLLKTKLKQKEKEIDSLLNAQRLEYENNIRDRDQEVTQFVDGLIKENYELKKTIVRLEIDLENVKDKSTEENRACYLNIKTIKESNERKQREITEKYEKISRNLQKETKSVISNIRKSAQEYKNKFLNSEIDEESIIHINQVEEQISIYENRLRLLNEDLKNKEKYSLVIEQKYEMLNEENKTLRMKIQEEKLKIFKKIEEMQIESETREADLLGRISEEITEKKNEMEKSLRDTLSKNQEYITEICREKERLKDELLLSREKTDQLRREFIRVDKERESLETKITIRQREFYELEEIKIKFERENSNIAQERDSLKKQNLTMHDKVNDLISKNSSVEITNKMLSESISRETERAEQRSKNLIDALNLQISDYEKRFKEISSTHTECRATIDKLNKKNDDMNKIVESYMNMIEKLQHDLTQKDVELKIHSNDLESLNGNRQKLSRKIEESGEILISRETEIKNLRQTVFDSEIQVKSLSNEYERISKLKEEYFNKYEECKKDNIILKAELETSKITTNMEIQRLRNQISDFEKTSEKYSKIEATELSFVEMKNDLRNLKSGITKLYKLYLRKFETEGEIGQYEESKMLDEISFGFDKIVDKFNEKIKIQTEETTKYKKKLNTVMQITNTVGNQSVPNSNASFKSIEKDANSSLYESILVYLKNSNLKHLLEIFDLNLQREEEVSRLLSEKTGNSSSSYSKLNELGLSFSSLKKLCDNQFNEYQSRTRSFVQLEDFEKILLECKNFIQNLIDLLLDTLMNYKAEVSSSIIFKIPLDDYNLLIENISANLDKFSNKINTQIDGYSKANSSIEKAIDLLHKNTAVEYDVVNTLLREKFI